MPGLPNRRVGHRSRRERRAGTGSFTRLVARVTVRAAVSGTTQHTNKMLTWMIVSRMGTLPWLREWREGRNVDCGVTG